MKRIESGIEQLDQLLYGGIPHGRTYLVSGEPGTGKTIFSIQYLLKGVSSGEKSVYISIDEKPELVILDIETLGWDIQSYLANGLLQILDFSSYFGKFNFEDMVSMDRLIEAIIQFVEKEEVSRLVIDPIAPLIFSERSMGIIAEYIRKLVFSLENHGRCTTFLTSYVPVGSEKLSQHGIEEFTVSGIIHLKFLKNHTKSIRSITIRKMRGTRIDLSEYSYEILPQRGIVLRQPI